jgi:DNA-binding CsgD family transcriptional regulator
MAQPELSQRELQVSKQMAFGKSNKEIGQVLYNSEHTVKNPAAAILEKLNAVGRTEAVALAAQRRSQHRLRLPRTGTPFVDCVATFVLPLVPSRTPYAEPAKPPRFSLAF